MYDQQNQVAFMVLYAAVQVLEAIVPIAILIVFVWLVIKGASSLLNALSPDAGERRMAVRRRHRLETMALWMAVISFITGGAMLIIGKSSDFVEKIHFPGVEMEHVGVPVVLIGVACSILFMLFKAKDE